MQPDPNELPRLNASQALELSFLLAEELKKRRQALRAQPAAAAAE